MILIITIIRVVHVIMDVDEMINGTLWEGELDNMWFKMLQSPLRVDGSIRNKFATKITASHRIYNRRSCRGVVRCRWFRGCGCGG